MPCYPFPGLFLIRLKFQIACFYLFVYLFTYVQFDRFNSIIIRNCFNQNQLRWTRNISYFFFQVVSSNYSLENNSYRCTYTFDSSTPLETRSKTRILVFFSHLIHFKKNLLLNQRNRDRSWNSISANLCLNVPVARYLFRSLTRGFSSWKLRKWRHPDWNTKRRQLRRQLFMQLSASIFLGIHEHQRFRENLTPRFDAAFRG